MGKYLEDRKLDSVLENYFEVIEERYHMFRDGKNIKRINRKFRESIEENKNQYKYFYIIIKGKLASGDNGSVEYSSVRLFGSNKKLSTDDFDHRCHLKHKGDGKLLKKVETSHTRLIKDDIDKDLRKYVLIVR